MHLHLKVKLKEKLKELYLNNNRLPRIDSSISIFTGLNDFIMLVQHDN